MILSSAGTKYLGYCKTSSRPPPKYWRGSRVEGHHLLLSFKNHIHTSVQCEVLLALTTYLAVLVFIHCDWHFCILTLPCSLVLRSLDYTDCRTGFMNFACFPDCVFCLLFWIVCLLFWIVGGVGNYSYFSSDPSTSCIYVLRNRGRDPVQPNSLHNLLQVVSSSVPLCTSRHITAFTLPIFMLCFRVNCH